MNKGKILLRIFIIILLITIYTYIVAIKAIPENIVIFQGEDINIKTILGLKVDVIDKENILETSSTNQKITNKSNKKNLWHVINETRFLEILGRETHGKDGFKETILAIPPKKNIWKILPSKKGFHIQIQLFFIEIFKKF